MILADTSVWVDHLRRGNAQLRRLLEEGRVACHPFVIGELACGMLEAREAILDHLARLPQLPVASHTEALRLVHARGLAGYWRTPAVLRAPAGRAALRMGDDELPLGLLGGVGEALEQDGTDEGAAHGPRGALPLQRRPGVEERPALERQGLGCRHDVDQGGLRGTEAEELLGRSHAPPGRLQLLPLAPVHR